jgi:hypothetical protein
MTQYLRVIEVEARRLVIDHHRSRHKLVARPRRLRL